MTRGAGYNRQELCFLKSVRSVAAEDDAKIKLSLDKLLSKLPSFSPASSTHPTETDANTLNLSKHLRLPADRFLDQQALSITMECLSADQKLADELGAHIPIIKHLCGSSLMHELILRNGVRELVTQ